MPVKYYLPLNPLIGCRYECSPGTAYDPETRSCLWVSKVPQCSQGADLRADSSEEFKVEIMSIGTR